MAKKHPIIGLNVSVGGNRNGYGNYLRNLHNAGLPICVHSQGDYGAIIEALQFPHPENNISYRDTKDLDGLQLDTPIQSGNDYIESAQDHTARLLAKLYEPVRQPSFDAIKDRAWLAVLNEVGRNKSEWLANFALEALEIYMARGIKTVWFSWAAGTPEPHHWEGANMRRLLALANRHPDMIAMGQHEYSFNNGQLMEGYPYKVGRAKQTRQQFRDMGYGNVQIFVKEFGWGRDDLPYYGEALNQINTMLLTDQTPEIPRAIWYFGNGYSQIAEKAWRMIEPLADFIIENQFDVQEYEPEEPDPPMTTIPDNHQLAIITAANSHPSKIGVVKDTSPALRTNILEAGEDVASSEIVVDVEGVTYVVQIGRFDDATDDNDSYHVWQPNQAVTVLKKKIVEPEPEPSTPFELTHWPTDHQVITQAFGANPQYCSQFNLPGHEGVDIRAPHASPIFAAADGVVYRTGDDVLPASMNGHNYGIRVYLNHTDGYRTAYAHLTQRVVNVGQFVRGGQIIGYADSTGNSNGSHLHFNLYKNGATESGETNYPYDIIDPTPFLNRLLHVDVWSYIAFNGEPFMVENFTPDGMSLGKERIQHQLSADGNTVYIVKNEQYEQWELRGDYIYLVRDTSPDPAITSNIPHYYEKHHGQGWCKRWMKVGETYRESSPHSVLFRSKSRCRSWLNPPSGTNTDETTLFYADDEKIVIGGNEKHTFLRGVGRSEWESAWGTMAMSTDDAGTWQAVREVIECIED